MRERPDEIGRGRDRLSRNARAEWWSLCLYTFISFSSPRPTPRPPRRARASCIAWLSTIWKRHHVLRDALRTWPRYAECRDISSLPRGRTGDAIRGIPREGWDANPAKNSVAFVARALILSWHGLVCATEVDRIRVNKLQPRTREISSRMKYLNLIPSA